MPVKIEILKPSISEVFLYNAEDFLLHKLCIICMTHFNEYH